MNYLHGVSSTSAEEIYAHQRRLTPSKSKLPNDAEVRHICPGYAGHECGTPVTEYAKSEGRFKEVGENIFQLYCSNCWQNADGAPLRKKPFRPRPD